MMFGFDSPIGFVVQAANVIIRVIAPIISDLVDVFIGITTGVMCRLLAISDL